MVDIIPLRGLFYNKNKVENISRVISPPYDVISSSLKKELYNSHTFNIINLIQPEGRTRDKYKRAGKILNSWIKDNILKPDSEKCFYIFEESFSYHGKTNKMSGFIGLTKIEPYSNLHIIPHEKTSSGVKKDRLKLLWECRTNFGMVFTLYSDKNHQIGDILENHITGKPFINTRAGYDSGLRFKLWKLTDPKKINQIIKNMKDKKLIIADGHHRYETALKYKNDYKKNIRQKKEPDKLHPEDFILTLYVNSAQNDFLILPTHRLIKFKNYPGTEEIIKIITNYFDIEINTLKSAQYIREKLLKSKLKGLKSFFLYDREKKLYFLTFKRNYIDNIASENKTDRIYSTIDLNILHKFFIEKISTWHEIKKISYTHSGEDVIDNLNYKKFDIGIFLNAPPVVELENICSAGYLMPEKSTYFYPKPCSGLVMYKFDIF